MKDANDLPELPSGWAFPSLADVVIKISNGFTQRQDKSGAIPVTRIETISKGIINLERVGYLSGLSDETIEKYKLQKGDILFSHINSDLHLGKSAVFNSEELTLLHGMNLLLIRPNKKVVSAKFLNHLFNYYRFEGIFISIAQHAVNQSSINQAKLNNLRITLPPPSEQQRIVAKIEELFTKLDAGVGALKKARAQLGRYRQAVLKEAVTGELTREWREAHRGELEPATGLLARILRERRAKWEADQLAKMQAAGKTPKNDDWKQKYQEPAAPDTSELPELPERWSWTTIDQLASFAANSITDGPFGSNLKSAHYTESGPRVIRLQNIGNGIFVDERAHISETHFLSLAKHQILAGDIVIASLGEVAPRSCIIPASIGAAIVKADCIRFNPNNGLAVTDYTNYALNADPTRKRTTQAIHGVGRPRLGLSGIRQIAVPLPPLAEQHQIVSEVERLLSIADAMERAIEQSLKQAERLRQSILRQAFAGKLVPQDPNDEPAARLLERIREERAREAEAKPKQKRKSSKGKQATQTAFFS